MIDALAKFYIVNACAESLSLKSRELAEMLLSHKVSRNAAMRGAISRQVFLIMLMLCASIPIAPGQSSSSSSGLVDNKTVIRAGYPVGVIDRGVLQDMRISLQIWGTNVAKRASDKIEKVEAHMFEAQIDFVEALKRKEIDLMILNTLDYLELENTKLMEPFYVGFTDEKVGQEYVLLVRNQNNIDSVHQLRNKSINIDEGIIGQLPRVWLEVSLWNEGIPDMQTFFKTINSETKTSKAVLSVFFGTVDACVTNLRAFRTLIELNPQLEKELKILKVSEPLLRGLFLFRKDLDQEIKSDIGQVLRTIHEDPDGQQILMLLKEEKLTSFKPENLATVRALVGDYKRLQQEKMDSKANRDRFLDGLVCPFLIHSI